MNINDLLRFIELKQAGFAEAKRLYGDRLAPDFTPFDFIDFDEMGLSRILAWLLNPEATHGQGGHFLRLFLDRLATGWSSDDCERAKVKAESPIKEGRLDIIVRSGDRALVIENKPWAADQPTQLERYFRYLDSLLIHSGGLRATDCLLIYLTADGSFPPKGSICDEQVRRRTETGQLHCWSYREHILNWTAECRAVCRADRVSIFIDEFARYIRKSFAEIADMTMQDRIVEEIVSSPAMVSPAMQIAFAADAIRDSLLLKLRSQISAEVARESWTMDWGVSARSCSGLNIDFSPQLACFFRIEFYVAKFNDLSYGVFKKDKSRLDDGGVRAALLSNASIGRGEGAENELWPWWRHAAVNDDLIPFERHWGSSTQPWAAIADGQMAKAILGTARRFRDAMLVQQNDASSASG